MATPQALPRASQARQAVEGSGKEVRGAPRAESRSAHEELLDYRVLNEIAEMVTLMGRAPSLILPGPTLPLPSAHAPSPPPLFLNALAPLAPM